MQNKKKATLLWAFGSSYFVLLTLLSPRPLYRHLSTHGPQPGDNLYFIWRSAGSSKPFSTWGNCPEIPIIEFPLRLQPGDHRDRPAANGLAMPFALSGNFVLGYNISILLTFILRD